MKDYNHAKVKGEIDKGSKKGKILLLNKLREEVRNNRPILLTCNRNFPKVKPIIEVNIEYSKILHELPVTEFRRNKNIKQILARNIIENNKNFKKLNS